MITENNHIDIVLATYNGKPYLSEQIDSILAQEHPHWTLIARDDGSTDGTQDILHAYASKHPEKIRLLTDACGNLGPVRNFSRLIECSNAQYTALCDQDDVWLPGKLKQSLDRMKALETAWSKKEPLLVFGDLTVVDRTLNTVSESFWSYHGVDPSDFEHFVRMLLMNVVTGCTMLMNRPLRDLAAPIPAEAKVHDWWIALCAAVFGHAATIETPTVLYRKHGANSIGASRPLPRFISDLANPGRYRRWLARSFVQARAFRQRFEGLLPDTYMAELDAVISIPDKNTFSRYRSLIALGIPARASLALAILVPKIGYGPTGREAA